MTPDHRGIRLPWDRDCELAFVNLLRQSDADNDASRIVERLESQHRLQSSLHTAVVLLHNVVQVLTATNSHRIRASEVELPVHSHAPQRAMVRPVAIQGDAMRLLMMLQCLRKECLRRRNAACSRLRQNSTVLPCPSTALYRYINWPLTLMKRLSPRRSPKTGQRSDHRPGGWESALAELSIPAESAVSASSAEPYREIIEHALDRGRNAMASRRTWSPIRDSPAATNWGSVSSASFVACGLLRRQRSSRPDQERIMQSTLW